TCVRPSPIGLFPPPSVQLCQGDGKGKFIDVTAQAGDLAQLRADCVSAIWADLNNDNLPDLIVTSKTGLVRVYLNQGDGKFHYATHDLGLEQKFKAEGVLAADFNNDGNVDLVLIGAEGDPCVALLSKLKGKLAPLTVRFSGPDCPIGASVRITDATGKSLGTRWIAGGDGRAMQAEAEARFALAPGKYRVEVRYSSRKVRVKDVAIADKPVRETVDDNTPRGKE
ncbi:MAG: VCBS repeat-containing protein, partial [Planctomycetes bacterium]|nr:VCBS repeat-containing protein [Planctomycetota bacterium]